MVLPSSSPPCLPWPLPTLHHPSPHTTPSHALTHATPPPFLCAVQPIAAATPTPVAAAAPAAPATPTKKAEGGFLASLEKIFQGTDAKKN